MTQRNDAQPLSETGGALVKFKQAAPEGWRWCIGERVRKRSGSAWHGFVVGYYWSTLTNRGVCVESAKEKGSVQIYPEAALEPWEG